MRILFTKNDKFWSKVLMWTFEEPVSHLALEFDNLNLVIESSSHGVKIKRSSYFIDKNIPQMILNIPCSYDEEVNVFNCVMNYLEGEKYDFNAYFWLGLLGFRRKFFGIPLPDRNIMQSVDGYLCTEILFPITSFLYNNGYDLYDIDLSIMTPHGLYLKMIEKYTIDKNKIA